MKSLKILGFIGVLGVVIFGVGLGDLMADTGLKEKKDRSAMSAPPMSAPLNAALLTLGEAVDNTGLVWTTGGNANWFAQSNYYYYDNDAAQSGAIGNSQQTYIQTTVAGPGTLTFYWKVSSENNYDYLRFYIDGNEQSNKISGTVDWTQKSYSISSGTHTLKWEYKKDGSQISGSDCGWIDKVEFVKPGTLSVTSTPSGARIYLDSTDTGYVTNRTFTNISAGTHTIKLTLSGYNDWSGTATVIAGSTTYSYATLTLTPTTGSLTITSTPPGAKIYLDGTDTGKTTPATLTTTQGTYTLKLTLSGYQDWLKQVYLPVGEITFVTATFIPIGVVLFSNDYIEAVIKENGNFTMGTKQGDPDNPNDNNKNLLCGHPSPNTGASTIQIDGTDYWNYLSNVIGTVITSPYNSGSSNITAWNINGIRATQTLTLVNNPYTGRQDIVELRYTIKNTTGSSHNIGVRVMLDTELGSNDGAFIKVPGSGTVSYETELTGNAVPNYWQAFENLATYSTRARGILKNELITTPDRFVVADWDSINDYAWNFTSNPTTAIEDSAVGIYWNPVAIPAGGSKEFITYYGVDKTDAFTTPLRSEITAPQRLDIINGALSPNPFSITLYLENSTPEISGAVTGISARLDLPDGLSGSATQQYPDLARNTGADRQWSVRATGERAGSFTYSFTIGSNQGNMTVGKTIYVPDLTPPTTPVVTDDGTYTTSTTQLHAVWSSDDPQSGIAEYKYAIGTISGGTDTVGWTSVGTATGVTKTGLNLSNGQRYYFVVKARNLTGDWSKPGISNGITVDITPPTGTLTAPVDTGVYSTSTTITFVWTQGNATDTESGIAGYWLQVGTYPGGNNKFDADVGDVLNKTITGCQHGYTYYARVKAKNGAGLYGSYSSNSDGITIDTTLPTIPVVTDDGVYTTNTTQLHAKWSSSEDVSGIAEYRYAIGTTAGGIEIATWTSVGTATEGTATGLTLINGEIYYFAVKARNGAGLWSTGTSNGITVDTTPPLINLVSPTNGSNTSNIYPTFVWQGTDTESGIARYSLYINGTFIQDYPAGITSITITDWKVFGTQTPFGIHTWYVVAYNNAGFSTRSEINTLSIFREIKGINLHITQIEPYDFPEIDVYAEVIDQYPFYIEGLGISNFAVKEDGISESVVSVVPVSGTENIISVVLDIDRSGSMDGNKINDARIAACRFVDNMQEEDKAEVIIFASSVIVNQPFTNNKVLLKQKINSITAGGWTALYDSIWKSVEDLYRLGGQRASIVLTDGKDEGGVSSHTKAEVIAYAKQCGIPVYTIGLGSDVEDEILKEIAEETGGKYYFSPTSDKLTEIYLLISQKLREQYKITYNTLNLLWNGSTRTVLLNANYQSLTGSDTGIYKGPTSPGPSSTITTLPLYLNLISFPVSWTGTGTHGVAELDSFDIQYKDGVDGGWRDWLIRITGTSATFGISTGIKVKEGHTYYFQSRAWDKKGLWEAYPGTNGDTHVTIDLTPPTSNVSALPQYVAPSFVVSWTGTDTLAGVKYYDVQYSKGGTSTWTDWLTQATDTSATFGPATESVTYYFRSRAQDNAGNWEEYSTQPDAWTTPDTTPPTGSPTAPVDTGVYSTSTTITFVWTQGNATDTETGIAGYWLQVGTYPGGNNKFDGDVGDVLNKTITGCQHSYTYYARVKAKNGAGLYGSYSSNSDGITVDTVPPTTTDNAPLGWQGSNVTVVLTPTDTLSCVAQTYYTTDGSTPTTNSATGTTISLTTDGTYTIKYFSVDNAGNAEVVKTATNIVKIDKTPPSAFGLLTPANNNFISDTLPTLTWSPSEDLESGIKWYEIYIDGAYNRTINGTSAQPAQTLTLTSHTWYVLARNYAGLSKPSASTYTLHILPPITITPEVMTTVRGGKEVSCEILVNNTTICPATFSLTLSGLDSSWYSLSPSSLSLSSGEIGNASLRVSVPITYNIVSDTETLTFWVQETEGKVGSGSARLVGEKYPIAHNLLPEDGSKISSKDVVFSWETYIVASTEVYIKKEGESGYTKYMGQDGFLHSITVPNLQRDKNYTYYVKSRCKVGEYASLVKGFYIENGIVFSTNVYNFSVERDYNQQRMVEVKNIDSVSHNLLVELTNSYNDLAIGFTGEGSEDNIISLAAGESKYVNLSIHTQDAVNRNYELAIKASTPSEADLLVDTAKVNLNVRQPNIDFSFTEISSAPQTLVKRFRVTNNGDPLTDLTIVADEKLKKFLIFSPLIEHTSLSSGGSIEFSAIPILSYLAENPQGFVQGVLKLTAVQSSKQLSVDFSPPQGKSLWAVTLNNVFVGSKNRGAQCTNLSPLTFSFQIPSGIDRAEISKAYLSMRFEPRLPIAKHNVYISINGTRIVSLNNTVPSGSYVWAIPKEVLIIPNFGVASNRIVIDSTINRGSYLPVFDIETHLSISKMTLYACASTYSEAEQIAKANPYFTPEPAWVISIKEPAEGLGLSLGKDYTIKATSPSNLPYVMASFSNGDSNIRLNKNGDGTYTGNWTPQRGSGECVITVIGGACSNVVATRTINIIPAPILNVSVETKKNHLLPGATLKYTINYSNDGTAQATNVKIEDFLPEGTLYEKCSANYDAQNSKFFWNLGNLASGAGGEVSFEVTVNQGVPPPQTLITNKATISSNEMVSESNEVRTNVTIIRALDVKQNPVSGATVTVGWTKIGRTNCDGYLVANNENKKDTLELSKGDRIEIEKMIHKEPARKHTGIEPDMFELYLESGTITADGSWNNYIVGYGNTNDQHNLILAHPIFKWNLVVGAFYKMEDNDFQKLARDLRDASNYLYDVTDGQMMLGRIHLYDSSLPPMGNFHTVDYLIFDLEKFGARAYARWDWNLGTSTGIDGEQRWGKAFFGRNENPRTYIHEFGHYALGLLDEYVNGEGKRRDWWNLRNILNCWWRSENHPKNYGLMDYQYSEPTEMSSKNDYLENRSGYNGRADETMQLYRRETSSWDWTKLMFDNPRPEGFTYNVNAYTSTTPSESVSLVLPPPGHYDPATHKSTGNGDREGPHNHNDVGKMYVFRNGGEPQEASAIAALWNPDLVSKRERVPVFSQSETSPKLIVDVKMKGEGIFSISILSGESLSGVPTVEIYDELGRVTTQVIMSRIGSSNEYRGEVEIGDAEFGEVRIGVTDLSGNATSYTSKFNLSPIYAGFPSTLYDYYGARLLNLQDDSLSFSQEGVALTSGIRPIPPSDPDLILVSKVYSTRLSSGATILNSPGWLDIDYLEELMEGIDKNSLAIYRWDKNTLDWVSMGGDIYVEANSISTSTDKLGIYAVFGRKSPDKTPPGKIEDLIATIGTESCKVNLSWTAPGDDGNTGTATLYILRYNTEKITEANWGSSTSISVSSPSHAGATERLVITMPEANRLYWFAIKTQDEAGNISTLSVAASATSYMIDTDGDGMPDDWEERHNLNPNTNDSSLDSDGDGLTNLEEYHNGTDPNNPDSDGDGLTDGQEVNLYQTNPNNQDSDNDGLSDYREVMVFTTNPNSADTDGGGEGDASEVLGDRNPNNPTDDLSTSGPESPKGLSAIPSDKRIDLSWNLSQEMDIKGYKICYGISTNSYTASVDVGNVVSYQLQNLNNSTRYYIALKAYNLAGSESGYSTGVNATPIDTVPPSAINDLFATRISSTSVLLNWTATGDNGNEGNACSYDIRYSTSTLTEGSWNGATQAVDEPSPKIAGLKEAFTVTNLSPGNIYCFGIKVCDEATNTSSLSNVATSSTNRPPVLSPIGNKQVSAGTPLEFTISATDPDGDTLNYTALGLPSGASLGSSSGVFAWTPIIGQEGNHQATFTVTDDEGDYAKEEIIITVGDINAPPELGFIPNIVVSETQMVSINATATDPNSDTLTFTFSGWMSSATYTTTYNDAGVHTVTVTVSDGTLTDSQDVIVTVNDLNRAPFITSTPISVGTEGTPYTYLVRASDLDGDSLSYTLTTFPSGSVINASTGLIIWTPDYDQQGSRQMVVRVSDGKGGSGTQSFGVNVADVDITAPTITVNTPDNTWFNTLSPIIDVDFFDDKSLDKGWYKIGVGGSWQVIFANNLTTAFTGNFPIALPDNGTYNIYFKATDSSGNLSEPTNDGYILTLRVDTVAPITSDNAPSGWQPSTVTVTLTATDTLSGVSHTYYSINQQGWFVGITALIFAEGTNTLSYYSVDNAGNIETTKTTTVRIDRTPPVTSDNAPSGWQTANVVITLIATDTLSGVAQTYYTTDGSTPTTSSATGTTINLTTDGTYTIKYFSIDNIGNTETTKTSANTVMIDRTLPVTSDDVPSGWQPSTVTVTLTATDTLSGIHKTYYSLNQQDWVEGTTTTISTEGTNTLFYCSTDVAGNIEQTKTTTVRIDRTPPVTSDNAPSGWQTANVVITLITTDALSGVTQIYYTTDGSTPTTTSATGTTINLTTDGTYTIKYFSVDNVGNTETVKIATNTVMIDKTDPVTTDNAPTGWQTQNVTVTLTTTDTTSGVEHTYYSINQGEWVEGTTTLISAEGTNTLSYYSVDNAGNIEATNTTIIRIDRTPPTTQDNVPLGWQNTNVVITLTATDTLSGVAQTYYTTDGSTPTTNSATGTTINLITDGTYTIKYFSLDNVGNTETIKIATNIVIIDKTPPVTSDDAPSGWQPSTVTVTLTATDTLSGVTHTYYSINQGGWVEEATATISVEGINTLSYYSTDIADNIEATRTTIIRIDRTPPATTDNAPSGWQNTNVIIALTATDTLSGVAQTYYTTDGSTPTTNSATETTITLTTDGTYTIKYFSVDNVGNTETVKTSANIVMIDKTSPVTGDNTPSGWQPSTVTVTLTATDTLSGVTHTYYSINQGGWVEEATATISVEGINTLSYYSTDIAGNIETTRTTTIRIDRTPPVTTDNAPSGWHNSDVVITLTATDILSGVARSYYTTDGSTPTTNSATETTITLTTDGTYTIKYFSVDNVGNTEAIKTATNIVMIDKTPPVVTISTPINGTILLSTQTTVAGSITDISQSDYGTLTIYGTISVISITGDSFTATATLCYGENFVTVAITDKAGNIGSKTVIVEVVTVKATLSPNQTDETETADGTKIETLKTYPGTMTIIINNMPKEANFAVADKNLPKGVDISQLAEAVREFKLFEEEDATAGTTTGRFKITIPYPVTIPDDKAKELRIFWMDPSDNKWKLVGGTVDTANHTVTVEVDHLSIFRVAFYTFIANDLSIIRIYPNPFRPYDKNPDTGIPYDGSTNSGIIFDHLSEDVTIRIFNLAGELIDELSGITGKAQWDANNNNNKEVASGVYIYLITDRAGNKKTGKLTIIR